MKNTVWIGILFAVVVLGAVVLSSLRSQPYQCRVCVTFKGQRDCRTASGETREATQRAAVTTACAQLASGVVDSSQCANTPPDSVDWLKGN